jgi:hypothetical protein
MKWEPFPISGRTSQADLEWLYELGQRFHTVVEVGGGRSTFALLAGNFARWGHDGRVYCVDCWPSKVKGTHDEFNYEVKDVLRRGEFMRVNGNVPNLNVIEVTSEMASRFFDQVGAVFLDGGTINMLKDAVIWRDKAKKTLAGHDYSKQYPDVVNGLDMIFGSNLRLVGNGSFIWWVER